MDSRYIPYGQSSISMNVMPRIDTPPEANGKLILKDGIFVVMDFRHRYEDIHDLLNDLNPVYNCIREPRLVFLTLRTNVFALSAKEMTENSKLLNLVSSTVFPFSSFLPVIRSFVAYGRALHEAYKVPFRNTRVVGIPRDLKYANVISIASTQTYKHYIRVSFLCVGCYDLLPSLKSATIEAANGQQNN